MDLYSEDIVSVSLYIDRIEGSISLDSSFLRGLLIYYNENEKLSINELHTLFEKLPDKLLNNLLENYKFYYEN